MNPNQRRVPSQEYSQQEQVQQFHPQMSNTPVFIRASTSGMNVQRVVQHQQGMPMLRTDHQMGSGSGHMVYAQHHVQGQQQHMQQPRPMNQQTTILRGMPPQQQMQRPNTSQQQQQMQRPPTPQQQQMQRPPTPQQQHQMQQQMQRSQTPQQHQMQQIQQGQQPMSSGQMQQGQQQIQQQQMQHGQQQLQQNQQQMQQQQNQQQMQQQQQQIQRSQTPQQQQAQRSQTPQQGGMAPPKQPGQQRVTPPNAPIVSTRDLTAQQVQDVHKLGRLLRTTIILASKHSTEKGLKMANYVTKLIYSEITEQDFIERLKETVGHSAQAKLLEFFELSLPFLRNEILSGRLAIETVVRPPAQQALNDANSQGSPAPSFHGPSPQLSTTTSVSSPMFRQMVEPGSEPAHQPRASIPFSPLTLPPASAPALDPAASVSSADGQPTQQILYHANTGSVNVGQPQVQQFLVPHPPQQNQQQVIIGGQQQMVQLVQPVATSSAHIPAESGIVIQPVEAMEESEPPRPSVINPTAFAEYCASKLPGVAIEEGVVDLVSELVEARIKALLIKMAEATEKRLFNHRNDPCFVEVEDTRSQLRTAQKFDSAVIKRRLDAEKERELSSKPKGKSKDADAIEKAKLEKEAYLNREANAAATAALSGKRKRIANDPPDSGLSRFRKHVITQKDLNTVFENDKHCQHTNVYARSLLGLDEDGKPFQ